MLIHTLLDNDLYKFTMMQAVFHQFREVPAEYEFVLRSKDVDLSDLKEQIEAEVKALGTLAFTEEEIDYLSKLAFSDADPTDKMFQPDFIAYLKAFKFNPGHVQVSADDNLHITIRGPWLETILFEIPLLMIISESYYRRTQPDLDKKVGLQRLDEKIQTIHDAPQGEAFRFADFGSRRRFSFDWQQQVLKTLKSRMPNNLIGTSNLHFARTLGLRPIGTMAHEFIQAGQALAPDLASSQCFAWQKWLEEYHGQLGVVLSDTLGEQGFRRDFNEGFAQHFSGVRQDSGNPHEWARLIIQRFRNLNLDSHTKTLVFSDGLNFPKALELQATFSDQINVLFGIGTNLMNDLGPEPLSIVIKMSECNHKPVAKLATDEKTFCKFPPFLKELRASICTENCETSCEPRAKL